MNSVIEKIYRKILEVYPFLTKDEQIRFEKKSFEILNAKIKTDIQLKKYIQKLLGLLNNGHADLQEFYGPKKALTQKNKSPFFKIKDDILYINIPSWNMLLGNIDEKLINVCVKNKNKYNAVIIDVRNNEGGASRIAHNFAGIFFKRDLIYGKFKKKNQRGKLTVKIGKLKANKKDYIDKPVAILISKKCFSSNELFLAPFKISKRAILIGQKTRGGSANPISERIIIGNKKYIVRVPTWRFYLKNENEPLEETAINPDIEYRRKNIKKFAKSYLLKKHLPFKLE